MLGQSLFQSFISTGLGSFIAGAAYGLVVVATLGILTLTFNKFDREPALITQQNNKK
ncbi:hypothetical protein [Companilactobacillus zhongbaensis]|uniref:hypothetical protein n=1 Tax=Companilactobacillus zhongbaensis TaxID=2486009 RepID=UPI0013DE154C|nr:hypothetical protein [Companilactobacillus zhongbaensis]